MKSLTLVKLLASVGLAVTPSSELSSNRCGKCLETAFFLKGADFSEQRPNGEHISFGIEGTGIGAYTGDPSIIFYHDHGIAGELSYGTGGLAWDWMDTTYFQEDVYFEAGAIVSQEGGTGNAYACFDDEGRLFRSEAPCR